MSMHISIGQIAGQDGQLRIGKWNVEKSPSLKQECPSTCTNSHNELIHGASKETSDLAPTQAMSLELVPWFP